MGFLFDSLDPAVSSPDLFTLMWVSGLVLLVGSVIVYNIAQNRYRRYPTIRLVTSLAARLEPGICDCGQPGPRLLNMLAPAQNALAVG